MNFKIKKNFLTGPLLAAVAMIMLLGVPGAEARLVEIGGKQYDIAEPGEFMPGEVIVRVAPGTTERQVQALAVLLQGRIKTSIPTYRLHVIKMPEAKGEQAQQAQMQEAVSALKRQPGVEAAYPNYKVSIPRPPAAPVPGPPAPHAAPGTAALADSQWHLDRIKFRRVESIPKTAPTIAVIDTGVDYNHPDLAGKVIKGWDFVNNDPDPMDDHGHGTHVAGIAAASGVSLVTGVSPTSKILAVKVLNSCARAGFDSVIQAIEYARGQPGIKIINLSLGCYYLEGSAEYNDFQKVINDTVSQGILVCSAAGNSNNVPMYEDNSRLCPAWFPNSFSVGATNELDCRAYFSNYDVATLGGRTYNYSFVDLVAPGWNVLSAKLGGGPEIMSGTSMACPVAAGAAARVWAKYPRLTPAQVAARLKTTGARVAAVNGFPVAEKRLDLAKALAVNETGLAGVVYNGQTGAPELGVQVTAGGVSTFTNLAGFFTLPGLPGETTYTLNFTKAGFNSYKYSQATVTGRLQDLAMPIVLNKRRAAGQWSLLLTWRSWHPGLYDATATKGGQPSWDPVNWDEVAGLNFTPYLDIGGLELLEPNHPGSLTLFPYAQLTQYPTKVDSNGYLDTSQKGCAVPAVNFIIARDVGVDYGLYAGLDNANSAYLEWGKYTGAGVKAEARLYYGPTLKATIRASQAVGAGPYWVIANIYGDSVEVLNFFDYYPAWDLSSQRRLGTSRFFPNSRARLPGHLYRGAFNRLLP